VVEGAATGTESNPAPFRLYRATFARFAGGRTRLHASRERTDAAAFSLPPSGEGSAA